MSDNEARSALRALEQGIVANRMCINDAHFFDAIGRRMQVDEA